MAITPLVPSLETAHSNIAVHVTPGIDDMPTIYKQSYVRNPFLISSLRILAQPGPKTQRRHSLIVQLSVRDMSNTITLFAIELRRKDG